MARNTRSNSRFSSTSGPGRENKRPGKNNPRSRDERSGDRKEKKIIQVGFNTVRLGTWQEL